MGARAVLDKEGAGTKGTLETWMRLGVGSACSAFCDAVSVDSGERRRSARIKRVVDPPPPQYGLPGQLVHVEGGGFMLILPLLPKHMFGIWF